MKALIIDDEPQIRRALRAVLEPNGYTVLLASTGEGGLDAAAVHSPDIVILDLRLPDLDGMEICRRLREWSRVPIIVLSVRDAPDDKVAALDLGADDYLTKPFVLEELLARMRAVLRRREGPEGAATFTAGELKIDFLRRRVTVAGREVHLTPTEYELLRTMVQYPDQVLTHRQLLSKVWGAHTLGDAHTLRVHMANLRSKIEPDPSRTRFIQTEPRIGYRFCA